MRTANRAFQLEATYPGIFLLQGLLGGILGGYISMVSLSENAHLNVLVAVLWMPYVVIPLSILAVLNATILWALFRLTGIQLGVASRVVSGTLGLSLLFLFIAYLLNLIEPDCRVEWLVTVVVASLPTGLLVGSTIKPWKLCTFGSIAGSANEERIGSTSVWATLGTLPLRFLSLGGLAVSTLAVACRRDFKMNLLEVIAALSIPLIYFLLSAYISFHSPRKTILLVVGLLLNLPVAGGAVLAYVTGLQADFAPETIIFIRVISATFVLAWVLFLAARLSVHTRVDVIV